MKKSYLFYGAIGAVVAIDYLIGNVGTDTAQVLIEVAPVEPLEEVTTASDERLDLLLNVSSMVFAIAIIPIIYKIIMAMMKP